MVEAVRPVFRLAVLTVLGWSLSSSVAWGQACCTLQGFNGNAAYGTLSDFDGLDFADTRKRTQLQFQLSGSDDWDDWVKDNTIINGPLLGYSLGLNRFVARSILLNTSLSGSISSMSEALSLGGSESNITLQTLRFRGNWFSSDRRHALWVRLIQPVVTRYSNRNFPFTLSPARSLEIGYGYVSNYVTKGGKPRIFAAN